MPNKTTDSTRSPIKSPRLGQKAVSLNPVLHRQRKNPELKSSKSIAIVANSTWNIYNFRQNVIRKCIEEGFKVYVLAPIDAYIEYVENFPEVVHINLRTLDRDSTNPIKDLLLVEELRRKYRKIKPDLVVHYTHKPNIFGTLAARLAGVKSVSVITGLGYSFINRGFINVVTEWLYRRTARYSSSMIFENEDDRDLFIQKRLVKEDRAFAVKGCGVNTVYYQSKSDQSPNPPVFTFIGRLLKDKGILEFASAARHFHEKTWPATFVVLGDFDPENPSTIDRDTLLEWISEDTVDYKGFVNDVRPFLEKSTCIVLPSYREGMPRIVLEAMAMGKPVITTRTAGCRETVEEGVNGFLAEARSVEDLIVAMEKFCELSPDQRSAMGARGRSMAVDVFSDTIIAEDLFRIFCLSLV